MNTKSSGKLLIGIAGGIGTGKSVVSRILRLRGYDVYDCDLQAALLMKEPDIAGKIIAALGKQVAQSDAVLNRSELAKLLFSDAQARLKLEQIVHPAVARHLASWKEMPHDSELLFVESAILAKSGLLQQCDAVLLVQSDKELRIKRVQKRNGLSRTAIIKRMNAQQNEEKLIFDSNVPIFILKNQETDSILDQVNNFLETIKQQNKLC